MIIINIAYEVPDEIVEKIRERLDYALTHDINFVNETFDIVRDDFTCIPEEESADACSLLLAINDIIDGITD